MTYGSTGSRAGRHGGNLTHFDRRRLLAAAFGTMVGSAGIAGAAGAQSKPSPAHGQRPVPEPASGVTGPQGLLELLSLVPQAVIDTRDGNGVPWQYADLARQYAALGVPHDERGPDLEDESWSTGLSALALGSNAFAFARLDEFTDAIGFLPLGVDQTLVAGDPPVQVTLFRGGLDQARLETAWEATGYTPMTARDGTPFWTIGSDGEFGFEHPVQRAVIASFNNLALLGNGALLCAPTQDLLETTLATVAGDTPSAADDPAFGLALRTLPETTVSALAVSPVGIRYSDSTTEAMQEEFNELIERSDAEVGPMPRFEGLITAVGAGAIAAEGDGGAGEVVVRIVTGSRADAAQALAVVAYRWTSGGSIRTGQPYTELMEITAMTVDGAVATVDFQQMHSPSVWRDIIFSKDTVPFMIGIPK